MAYKIIIFSIIIFLFLLITPFTQAAYNASDCLGQLDSSNACVYTKGLTNNSSGNRGLNGVRYSEIDIVNHRLFVADYLNNRVLIYNLDSSNNLIDRVADNVLGQSDFTSNTGATTQSGMWNPVGLDYDSANNRLFVAEETNSRILIFDTATITNGENAANVLGQLSFITQDSPTPPSQGSLNSPEDVIYNSSNNYLFVADGGNNRVMIFDVASITDGENAINVLGQADFITRTSDTLQNKMRDPYGLIYNSADNRLFVADVSNNRVLIFDLSGGITNGMDATYVLGQSNFTSSANVLTAFGDLNIPWYVYVLVTILLIILLLFTSKHLPKWVAVIITILIILLIIFGFLVVFPEAFS